MYIHLFLVFRISNFSEFSAPDMFDFNKKWSKVDHVFWSFLNWWKEFKPQLVRVPGEFNSPAFPLSEG